MTMPTTQRDGRRFSPPQTTIPDDLVPNRAGMSNQQLAIRKLANVVSQLILHGAAPDKARVNMLDEVADALLLTEST